jgi:hypothetical protein
MSEKGGGIDGCQSKHRTQMTGDDGCGGSIRDEFLRRVLGLELERRNQESERWLSGWRMCVNMATIVSSCCDRTRW